MRLKSEGVRRLSILLGTFGAFTWIILVLVLSEGFHNGIDMDFNFLNIIGDIHIGSCKLARDQSSFC